MKREKVTEWENYFRISANLISLTSLAYLVIQSVKKQQKCRDLLYLKQNHQSRFYV